VKPTVHLVGPGPHSETTRAWEPDAYSAKTRRLGGMLTGKGYRVVLYGSSRNESDVAQFVPLVSAEERERWFPGFSPHLEVWNNYDTSLEPWKVFNGRAAAEIRKRAVKGDILGLTMGQAHQPIAMALADMGLYTVETGIGYSGVFAPFRVFESHAWEHYLAGRDNLDHRQYDVVIGNSYSPDELPYGEGKGGFHLFAGRFIGRKGIAVAVQATAALKVPLVMIGPGLIERNGSTFRGLDSTIEGDHITHLGPVGPVDRARLMGEAAVVWGPTLYAEPWGGAGCAEPNFCGTPVITSDFGAFVELVENGVNGYRCRAPLQAFVDAARAAEKLDRRAIREYAIKRWSTDVAAEKYDAYFQQLMLLEGKGWATLREESDVDRVGVDVQPGSGEADGAPAGDGRAAGEPDVPSPARVRRRASRPRPDDLGIPAGVDGDGRAVRPPLRAVGD
jgi:hypothetical protein